MSEQQIVDTLIFFSHFFPFIRGDRGHQEELARKVAREMLNYKDHALWSEINILYQKLPHEKN